MLLECLEVGAAYAAELDQHNAAMKRAGKEEGVLPPPPAIMVAYNATTPSEFLQEILARIRPRYLISYCLCHYKIEMSVNQVSY